MGMTFYQVLWYFLIYSFGGWVVEVIFHAVTLGRVVNRGFLNGPVCPVYGFGVLSVFGAVNLLQGSGVPMGDLEIFLFGVFLATAVELIAGWLMDVFFHARWWDYSKEPLNFRGYICVRFSLIWGLAILLVVRILQKYVEYQAVLVDEPLWGWILLAVFYAAFLADFIVTVAILQGFNRKLTKLNELRSDMRIVSDKISDIVGTKTIETAQTVGEGRVQASLAKAELKDMLSEKKEELAAAGAMKKQETMEELKSKKEALTKEAEALMASLTKNRAFGPAHLLRAFPNMQHRLYPEVMRMLKEKLK